jgi:hypothetical protein
MRVVQDTYLSQSRAAPSLREFTRKIKVPSNIKNEENRVTFETELEKWLIEKIVKKQKKKTNYAHG